MIEWNEEYVLAAKKCISDNISIREGAKRHNLSRFNLAKYVAILRQRDKEAQPSFGSIFTEEENEAFKDIVYIATRMNYDITKDFLCKLAYQYAKYISSQRYTMICPQTWEKEKKADNKFYLNFKEDPGLPNVIIHMKDIREEQNLMLFFQNYKEIVAIAGLKPNDIWTCGETCVGEEESLVTMITPVNASGGTIPPMLIFPITKYKSHQIKTLPKDAVVGVSLTGDTNDTLFLNFIKFFHQNVNSSPDEPVLLLLSTHESHISFEIINFAKKNGIILLTYPPGSTRLQPLTSIFSYVNQAFEQRIRWQKTYTDPGFRITIGLVSDTLSSTYAKYFEKARIKQSFDDSGIYPINELKLQPCIYSSV